MDKCATYRLKIAINLVYRLGMYGSIELLLHDLWKVKIPQSKSSAYLCQSRSKENQFSIFLNSKLNRMIDTVYNEHNIFIGRLCHCAGRGGSVQWRQKRNRSYTDRTKWIILKMPKLTTHRLFHLHVHFVYCVKIKLKILWNKNKLPADNTFYIYNIKY